MMKRTPLIVSPGYLRAPGATCRSSASKRTPGRFMAFICATSSWFLSHAAPIGDVDRLEEDRPRVVDLGVERADVGRRVHPRQVVLVPPHRAVPPLHRDNDQVGADLLLRVVHLR